MPSLTYLHIRGTLAENMVYSPRRGHESVRPGRTDAGDPAFELVLLDENGNVLVSVNPQVMPVGCGRTHDPLRYRVRGSLPLHPNGVEYELRRGAIKLYKVPVPSNPPEISIRRCKARKQALELRWHAARRKHATYDIVAEMESGRRFVIARGLNKPGFSVDVTQIPFPGKGKLLIKVNDGVRSSEAEAASIEVPARPPAVHIISPLADVYLPFGQPVSVLGCCLDMSGKPCSAQGAVWLLDGEMFASGTWIPALERLQPGDHILNLEYGREQHRVATSVRLRIEEPDVDYRQWEQLMRETAHLTNRKTEIRDPYPVIGHPTDT